MLVGNTTSTNHRTLFRELFAGSDYVRIASPYIFDDFSEWIGELDFTGVTRLELVTTLASKGVDEPGKPAALMSLLRCALAAAPGLQIAIHINNRLHGKIWLFHKNGRPIAAMIGSANLTHSGMAHNHEWGIVTRDEALLAQLDAELDGSIELRNLRPDVLEKLARMADREPQPPAPPSPPPAFMKFIQRHMPQNHDAPLNIDAARHVFLKPIGHSGAPVLLEDARDFSQETQLHFSKPRPSDVAPGDILITFGTGSRAVLGVYTALTDVQEASQVLQSMDPHAARWPWSLHGQHHTPHFSGQWWEHALTIDVLSEAYHAEHPEAPLSATGGNSFGTFNFGADRLEITKDFARYIIGRILPLNQPAHSS